MRTPAVLAAIILGAMAAGAMPFHASATGPQCIYSLVGSLVSAGSTGCPPTGTPTIVSDAFGHASTSNGLLQYDEKLYFFDMNYPHGCPECYSQWSSDIQKAKLCMYNKDGSFWYPLSDAQKRVLLDLKENYTFFVCPFTGSHPAAQTPPSPPVTVPDGTRSIMNMSEIQGGEAYKILQWAGPNQTVTDTAFLHEMNMSGTYIPPWFKTIARWALDGKITASDFVNALEYLSQSGITGRVA